MRLVTLGEFTLRATSGEPDAPAVPRQKLALLAVLALAPRPVPRDTLVAMFWGDEEEERARHSLSNALSSLRRILGPAAIATRRAEVALSGEVRLAVDVLEFSSAIELGDASRAAALYQGPFLDGVYIEHSRDFELWAARHRARYERQFLEACETASRELAHDGRWDEAAAVAARWVEAAPDSEEATRALAGANAQRSAGRAATAPGVPTTDAPVGLAASESAAPVHVLESHKPTPDSHPPAIPPAAPWRRRFAFGATAAAVVGLAAVGFHVVRRGQANEAEPATRHPVIVVAGVRVVGGDTAAVWLGDGLQQMISADLARSTALEVVDPTRVRDVLARARLGSQQTLTSAQAHDVAQRLGATWLVEGGITRGGGGMIVLDVSVLDVQSRQRLVFFSVTGSDPMTVADQTAARVLSRASASMPGPHLAEIETSNLTAYQHYVRATQAMAEGREADVDQELDAAIAADSGFVTAIVTRLRRSRGDSATLATLGRAFDRASSRATEWDRLDQALYAALHNGENARAEAIARERVARYPHDPRAYTELADVLSNHGQWNAADTVFQRALSLDSLAALAGSGPCAPCAGYGGLATLRATFGDAALAERAARRWIALQPDVPLAWAELADILAYNGQYDAAVSASRRALWLGGDASEPGYDRRLGGILLMARRFAAADSLITRWRRDPRAELRGDAGDLQALLERERGQYRASVRTITDVVHQDSSMSILLLMRANSLARVGEIGAAEADIQATMRVRPFEPEPIRSLNGDRARKFAWEHALLADAIAATGDTIRLRALADSIEMVSTRSYYGRDWGLAHHVRGLIDEREGRWRDAAQEFTQARWGHAGWTRTNVELARSDLALGRAQDAIAVLRDAYRGPLDAMGRYVPRSELDWWMATAFARAGQRDSASVYAGYVRAAWQHADAAVVARLAALEPLVGQVARRSQE